MAAAGIATRVALGLALVGAASSLGGTWSVAGLEVLALVGWLYVGGGVVSLLPFTGPEFEGALLWGTSWAARVKWFPYTLVVLLGMACAGLTALQFPYGYVHAWLVEVAEPVPLAILGLWVATAVVVLSRLKLLEPNRSQAGHGFTWITR